MANGFSCLFACIFTAHLEDPTVKQRGCHYTPLMSPKFGIDKIQQSKTTKSYFILRYASQHPLIMVQISIMLPQEVSQTESSSNMIKTLIIIIISIVLLIIFF